MSLFKARELWVTQCGKDEAFDSSSLLIVDLRGRGNDSIIVGSHSGLLRIYDPQSDPEVDSEEFKPTDLLIETELHQPILQLAYGRLVSGSQGHHLGVLHSTSVAVYSVSIVAGSAEHGEQSQLTLAYEHQLRRSAFSFVIGPFGGIKGRDFLCVQALDGTLSFYEQETFAFDRSLPTFLLPATIVYVPQSDSFLSVNSNWYLESFRYGSLGDDSGRKLVSSWNYNLGEEIVDMKVVTWLGSEAAILVLGERHLFCLREGGGVRFVKRLQYSPLCFHPYVIEPDGRLMVLVVSDTNTLLIYEQTTLCWSAQLAISPVLITRLNFKTISGLILILSESGCLQSCYLGTEPALFVAPPIKKSQKSFEEAEQKLNNLQKEIVAYTQSSQPLNQLTTTRELTISAKVINSSLNETSNRCKVLAEIEPSTPLNNVQVTFKVQPPLVVHPQMHFITSLCEKFELVSEVSTDTMNCQSPVFSLELLVLAAYLNSEMTPQVVKTSIQLPLSLVLCVFSPAKEAVHKITLSSSQASVPLSQLFREFVGEDWENYGCNDSAVGFQHSGVTNSVVTVIISKSSPKYRIQTENLAAATLVVTQLRARLEVQYNSRHKEVAISHAPSALPLQELLAIIEQHATLRNQANKLQQELGVRTAQFRVIQRRLLAKLRDKTPSVLTGLDTLLTDSYNRILEFSHQLEQTFKELEECSCELSSVMRLVLLLIKMSDCAIDQDLADLTAAVSYTLHSSENQGWEEVCEAGVCYLLRTTLAKTVRDQQRTIVNPLKEVGRFKKHLTAAFDRVLNGSQGKNADEQRGVSPIMEGDEEALSARLGRRLSLDEIDGELSKSRLLPLRKQHTVALENMQIADEGDPLDLAVET